MENRAANMRNQLKLILSLVIMILGTTSCVLAIAPHNGGIGYGTYTYANKDASIPDGDVLARGLKMGVACITGESIIPFLYVSWRGDSSIRAAAANGGISKISSVASRYSRPLFGNLQECTIVYGE